MESWQTNSRRHRPGPNRPDSDSILLHNSVNSHQCKAHKGDSLLHLHLKGADSENRALFYCVFLWVQNNDREADEAFRDYFNGTASQLRADSLVHNITRTCTQSDSLGSHLLQEIKVGRSIQESPLILLPSYTTWNSPTNNSNSSLVNDHTEK